MSDALHEFAGLAANALRDITDQDATVHAADEALAALEQHVGSLPREYRSAGKLVARCLWQVGSREQRRIECATEEALTWLICACRWSAMGPTYANGMHVGENLERAAAVIDAMHYELRDLKALLRAVVAETRRALNDAALERQYGGSRAA